MTESFSGSPLVIGSVVGVRRFSVYQTYPGDRFDDGYEVDPLGLYPLSSRGMWTPGVNEARCERLESLEKFAAKPDVRNIDWARKVREHKIAGLNCSCGFYAYWADCFDIDFGSMIDYPKAIIRAWGTITAGTLGFRAEKAEILCLIGKNPKYKKHAERYDVPLYRQFWRAKKRFTPTNYKDLPKGVANAVPPTQDDVYPF